MCRARVRPRPRGRIPRSRVLRLPCPVQEEHISNNQNPGRYSAGWVGRWVGASGASPSEEESTQPDDETMKHGGGQPSPPRRSKPVRRPKVRYWQGSPPHATPYHTMYPSTRDDKTTGVPVPAPETTTAAQQIPPPRFSSLTRAATLSSAAQPGINDPIQPRPRLALRCFSPGQPTGRLAAKQKNLPLNYYKSAAAAAAAATAAWPCAPAAQ